MTSENMRAIQTVTVGSGGAATISFTSIPQTYTDLLILISGRTDRTADTDSIKIEVNGSTTGYSWQYLLQNNGVLSAAQAQRVYVDSDFNTANAFGSAQIYIPNYRSNVQKIFGVEATCENNSLANAQQTVLSQLWANTSAITSVQLSPQFGSNWKQYTTATLYGVFSGAVNAKATGGSISQDANYFYHIFSTSGTFTPTVNLTADYLVVAGGGGGGGNSNTPSQRAGGGGGAGGIRCTVGATGGGGSVESPLSLTASTNYTVTIGAGGAGGATDAQGTSGSNSVFSSITSTGGGGGGRAVQYAGSTGGSGGGGGAGNPDSSGGAGGAGTANQGYAGGQGESNAGGGGGGAGQVGAIAQGDNPGTYYGGAGGNGITTSISGIATSYGGGGQGGGNALFYTGGIGGGGNGAINQPSTAATPGLANTGGGGGGGYYAGSDLDAANGGSGIVIIRYAK